LKPMLIITVLTVAFSTIGAHIAAAQVTTETFMLVPGIPGESTAAGHEDWIDVHSFSQNLNGSKKDQGACTVSVVAAKLRTVASKGLKVKVPCASACAVRGTVTADKATARKLGASKVASGRGKAIEAGTVTVTLRAGKQVARRLKALKSAKVTVKITVTPQGGGAQTASRKLTLKR